MFGLRRKHGKKKKNDKVHVVNNTNAGKHTSHAGIGYVIGQILSQPRNPNKIYDTETLTDLEDAAKQIACDRPGLVVIVGGDGTVHLTLSQLLTKYSEDFSELPDIVIIPTGTMNLVATSVGCNRVILPPKALAQRIADQMDASWTFFYSQARVMKINDQYGFIYGTGLPVHVLESYYDDSGLRGGPQALKVLSRSVWCEALSRIGLNKSSEGLLEPIHATIRIDGHDPPFAPYMTHTAILASSIDQVGFGCRAMPDALHYGVRDGRFLIRSTQLTYLQLLAMVGQLWAGLPMPETFDAPVKKVVIEYKQPVTRMIDGELEKGITRDVIEIGPLLRFIVG